MHTTTDNISEKAHQRLLHPLSATYSTKGYLHALLPCHNLVSVHSIYKNSFFMRKSVISVPLFSHCLNCMPSRSIRIMTLTCLNKKSKHQKKIFPKNKVSLKNEFKTQTPYVSNIRGECFKHKAFMFQTFPYRSFFLLLDRLYPAKFQLIKIQHKQQPMQIPFQKYKC